MDAKSYICTERLSWFTEMLAASGWEHDGKGGWLAPILPGARDKAGRNFREVVALQYGKGHLHVWDAVAVQIKADLAYLESVRESKP